MRDLYFFASEAQRNFCNELFDQVEAQRHFRNFGTAFWYKPKRDRTFAINLPSTMRQDLIRKGTSFLVKKADN